MTSDLQDITNILNNHTNSKYTLDNKFIFQCEHNSLSIIVLDYKQIYVDEKNEKKENEKNEIKYIIYPTPSITYNIQDLIYLIVNKKIDTNIIYNKNVLDLSLIIRINNIMKTINLHFINSKIIDYYNEFYQYSMKLDSEKDNLIIQNNFESLRRTLINLKRLGYYTFLLNDINKISNKYKPLNDKHCVIM